MLWYVPGVRLCRLIRDNGLGQEGRFPGGKSDIEKCVEQHATDRHGETTVKVTAY